MDKSISDYTRNFADDPNELFISSSSNDFPEIRLLRFSTQEKGALISSEPFDQYIERINSGAIDQKEESIGTRTNFSVTNLSGVDYQYELDCPLLYSFTKTIVLTHPTNNVTIGVMGTSSPMYIDIFKDWVYTFSRYITGPDYFTQMFPPGTYTVHLRRALDSPSTVVPLCISYAENGNDFTYSICPVSGYNFETETDSYSDGIVNYFTCYQTYGTDPIMYLETGSSHSISTVNDNYSGNGDFDWTVNARTKTSYSSAPLVHIFNASPELPEGTCDLYVRIPFYPITDLQSSFPYIQSDDTMHSGVFSSSYNCIGWAGDLLQFIWPLYPSCPYYTPGVTPQEAFDNYFYARGYLKTGGNASNGGVALWAQNGEFTHASIRKNTRSMYPHGYDWETLLSTKSCGRLL